MKLNSTKNLRRAIVAAVCIGASAGGRSLAEETEPRPGSGDELEHLRHDVTVMKRMLADLLDLEQKRVEILSRAKDLPAEKASVEKREKSEKTEKTEKTDKPRRPPSLPPGKDDLTGIVSGTVKAPAGGAAIVYVEDLPGRLVRGRTMEIKQENKQFSPRWSVVQVGTKLEFPNADPVYHNVFSRSPGNTFDLGIYRSGDETRTWVATKPGVIDLFCNMHPNMTSSILVVPNNYYAEVKPDGSFMLADVPHGQHKIVAWAPNAQPVSAWVAVAPGKQITASFELSEKEPGHLNKLGQSYGSYR